MELLLVALDPSGQGFRPHQSAAAQVKGWQGRDIPHLAVDEVVDVRP